MSDSRRLAQELYEIRALALSHATSPQLGVSSVDGEGLVLRDGDGNDIGRIGGGENGMEVEYLYGPKPPQPSAPDVSADTNLISVRWDGLWADQSETDPDIVGSPVLDRVEVHVSSDENFVPDQIESLAGTMPVLDSGGQILVGPLAEAGDWYVVLLARGKDGQYGAPSDRVHVVTSVGLVENELFDLALRAGEAMESADGKNSVYYGDTEPEPLPRLDEDGEPVLDDDGEPLFSEFTEGDIWFGEGNMPHVWSEADGWVSAADERVDAINGALADFESDLDDVRQSADGKTSTFYRPTEPPVAESSEGDLWFDTSAEGGNRAHRFTDGAWVSVADQRVQTIQAALDDFESDLDTVRDTADGKNRTFYQSTMPATPPARAGDLWFNTANGMRLHRNNGATFIEVADGRIADLESEVENIDISGPLSEARTEWLADAAADAQQKAQSAAAAAEAAAKLYADAVATGAVEGELEGIQDYADQAAEAARQAAIDAAIAEARVIANEARDEALAAALDADAVISQTIAQFESDLDLVRESADGKSKITWSPNAPSGDGKAGDTWFRTSSNRIIGYWRHSGSSWVSMSLDATVIPNLDAGKITSGFIDSERIKAGSITSDMIAVGLGGNLLPDPMFLDAELSATRRRSRWEYKTVDGETFFEAVMPDPKGNGDFDLTDAAGNLRYIPVAPGIQYSFELEVEGPVWIYLNVRYSNGTTPTPGASIQRGGFGSERRVARFVIDPGDYPAADGSILSHISVAIRQPNVTEVPVGTVTRVFSARLSPMVGTTLIEPGAVTTEKITAGAVGATAIAAESIDASKIVAGGIQADSLIVPGTVGSTLIKDGAITTSKIEAGAITAQSGIIASLDAGVISAGTIDAARIQAGSLDGGVVLSEGSVGTTVIAGGAITTSKIASGAITAESGVIGSLDAGKITVGEMDGARIKAGTVTADKLLVGTERNLLPNGDLSAGSTVRWPSGATYATEDPPPGHNRYVDWGVSTAIESLTTFGQFPVTVGDEIVVELWIKADKPGSRVFIEARDQNGGHISATQTGNWVGDGWTNPTTTYPVGNAVVPTEWTLWRSRLKITNPDTTAAYLGGFYQNHSAGDTRDAHLFTSGIRLFKRVGTTLIEDGAITADKIQAGAVTTEKITAGGIDAGVITTGELRGELIRAQSIAASALAADAIDGKTITGATIRTSAAGARVEMTPTGLTQYNALGQVIADMSGGSFSVVGSLFSGRAGEMRTVLNRDLHDYLQEATDAQVPTLEDRRGTGVRLGYDLGAPGRFGELYYSETTRGTSPRVSLIGPTGSTHRSELRMNLNNAGLVSRRLSTLAEEASVTANTTGASMVAWNSNSEVASSAGMYVSRGTGASPFISGRVRGTTGLTAYTGTNFWMKDQSIELQVQGGVSSKGQIMMSSDGTLRLTAADALRLTSTGDMVLTSGRMSMPDLNSTTGTANLRRATNGFVGVIGSSRSLKIAEEPITVTVPDFADKLLSVDSVTWFDKAAAERIAAAETEKANGIVPEDDLDDVDPLRRIPGVIAEDLHDAGLGILVEYDDEGAPSSVMYDRIGPALIPVVRGLRDRINELEEKIGEWENG